MTSDDLKKQLGLAFHESGKLNRILQEQGVGRKNTNVEPLTPSPSGHRTHQRQRSIPNTGQPRPLPESSKPPPELDPTPEEMTSFVKYATSLQTFSGRSKDNQGILDFIEAIETQAGVECKKDEEKREKLQLRLFMTNLRGDARDMMNMLTPIEKDSWEEVKTIYIAKYKTKKEKKAKQKAREAIVSFKQCADESFTAYAERAMKPPAVDRCR